MRWTQLFIDNNDDGDDDNDDGDNDDADADNDDGDDNDDVDADNLDVDGDWRVDWRVRWFSVIPMCWWHECEKKSLAQLDKIATSDEVGK